MPDSFCDGIELCSISCKNLVPEKTWYQIDRHTCKFLVPVSWECVAGVRNAFLSGHPVSFWGSKFYSTSAVTSFRMLRWQLLVWMVNGSAAVQSAPTGPTAKQMPTQLVTKAGSHVSTVKLCEQQSGPVLPGQMCHTFTDCELLSHKVGWLSEENVIWLYSAIHIGSHWKIQDRRQIKNTDNTQTKHNPDKANNAKHSKTKLAWFSRVIQHSTRKQDKRILQCSRAHTGHTTWFRAVLRHRTR